MTLGARAYFSSKAFQTEIIKYCKCSIYCMRDKFSIAIEKQTATNLRYLVLRNGFSSYTQAIDWLLSSTTKGKKVKK